MLVFTDGFQKYTNAFLGQKYDEVSPDVSPGSIAQSQTSGRDGRGGLTFVKGDDSDTFEYPLYVQQGYVATDTITVGVHIAQTATQVDLGGRLLTIVDGGEDVFGLTTQVGINIMPDGTLQAVRANDPGTGIVLRGLDQDADSQTTLLGTSVETVDADDYLEIQVFHHPIAGSITVQKNNAAFWEVADVNTAISGRERSTSFCLGGFASVGVSDNTRHHEDLQAVLSDLHVINNIANPSDSRDPVSFIGDHLVLPKMPTSDETYTEFTPNPVQAHYLNVNEAPPDSGTTENNTATLEATDDFTMETATGDEEQVYLAYSAFIKSDSDVGCVSDVPAEFEAHVLTESTAPGEVHAVYPPSLAGMCNLAADFISHRAQTVCTIIKNGEEVRFKPSGFDVSEFWVGLSPLDAPPRRLYVGSPGGQILATFNRSNNTIHTVAGDVRYVAPYYAPWAGSVINTEVAADLNGDSFKFTVPETGAGMDVGFVGATTDINRFNFYNDTEGAFHFREIIVGSPYFFIGKNFSYSGETVYTYAAGDEFEIRRTGAAREFYQNGVLLETVAGALPTHLYAYALMGRWGFTGGAYSVQPRITNAVMTVGALNCISADYFIPVVVGAEGISGMASAEIAQWGLSFFGYAANGFAVVADPALPQSGPTSVQFGWDTNTQITFKIESGNVVLEVLDFVSFADNMTVVGNLATYTYSRPIADTDDFQYFYGYSVGIPVAPDVTYEYQAVNGQANQPVRLIAIFGYEDTEPADTPGITDVSFTFVPDTESGAMSYAGMMRQNTVDRSGTSAEAPSDEYRYKQSFLASTPEDNEITIDAFNESEHGYLRSE